MASPNSRDTLFVNSLAKGLTVLRAFDGGQTEMGLTELAVRTGLDRSAVQRLTNTLHLEGYLDRDPVTKRYRLGIGCLGPAHSYLWTDSLAGQSTQTIVALSERFGETFNLARLAGTDIVYIVRRPANRTQFSATLIGRRIPALNTSSGRAMISVLSSKERAKAVAEWPIGVYTEKTTRDRDEIAALVESAVEKGYSVSRDELLLHEIGLAAPIRLANGSPVGALHCSVSAFGATDEKLADIIPALLDAANRLTLHE